MVWIQYPVALLWVMDLELAQLGRTVEVCMICTHKSAVLVKRPLSGPLRMSLVDGARSAFEISCYL